MIENAGKTFLTCKFKGKMLRKLKVKARNAGNALTWYHDFNVHFEFSEQKWTVLHPDSCLCG